VLVEHDTEDLRAADVDTDGRRRLKPPTRRGPSGPVWRHAGCSLRRAA
jgi:hypothetical protein